ncbi:MAG: sulfite exporter TauE/SafE family protein [Verrucomicrobia bacterium]|nr:sulfite exporter TauE/SafE family protein [Verrucomicrobiota bacterium]MDE3047075.1 sulfite exporter TauE/SafE family protein [Verrucomicrobiota bacterium]
MLGIGGGVVTVPFLYYFFQYSHLYPSRIMQIAVCTSLAAAFVTSVVSTYVQMRKKAIQVSVLKWMAPALLVGSISGSILAHYMASHVLSWVFGAMALVLGIYFFFPHLPVLKIARSPNPTLSLFGLGIGALSTMLGIGGGSISFPVLLGYHVPVQNASATSSATTCISTGIGTIAFLILSWGLIHEPMTVGYIDLPCWFLISFGSVLTVPLGVKWSHTLNVSLIKRVFGVCLFLVGLAMLLL